MSPSRSKSGIQKYSKCCEFYDNYTIYCTTIAWIGAGKLKIGYTNASTIRCHASQAYTHIYTYNVPYIKFCYKRRTRSDFRGCFCLSRDCFTYYSFTINVCFYFYFYLKQSTFIRVLKRTFI